MNLARPFLTGFVASVCTLTPCLVFAQAESATTEATATNIASAKDPTGKKPPAKNPNGQNNVVLGRELVRVTKELEDVARLQQEALSARTAIVNSSSFGTYRLNTSKSTSNLETSESRINQITQSVAVWSGDIERLKEQVNTLQNEFASVQQNPPAATQAIATDSGSASPKLKVPPEDAPPGTAPEVPEAADGAGTSALPNQSMLATNAVVESNLDGIKSKTKPIIHQMQKLTYDLSGSSRKVQEIKNGLPELSRLENERFRLQELGSYLDSINRLALLQSSLGTLSLRGLFDQDRMAWSPSEPPQPAYSMDSPSGILSLLERTGGGEGGNTVDSASSIIQDLEELIQKLEAAIEQIANEAEDTLSDVKSLKDLRLEIADTRSRLDNAAGNVLDVLQRRLDVLRTEKTYYETELNDRDATLSQFSINKLLVYAVYGMVLSILALFVLLRWYPGSLTELIVEQRVFVEVLSMGFLLLTIIILGSGKLITGEGLAGLLGTIAGYLFAKKTSDLNASRERSTPAATIERQLAQAHLDAADLETQLKRLETQTGDSPNVKQQKAIAAVKSRVEAANVRVEKLASSLSTMAKLKPDDKVEGDDED